MVLFLSFLQWWYGPGWLSMFSKAGDRMSNLMDIFSVPILLKTLFSPWKQLIWAARKDQPLNMKMRAVLDNIVSRFVGFGVRFIVLLTAVFVMLGVAAYSALIIIMWPLIPASLAFLFIAGMGVL